MIENIPSDYLEKIYEEPPPRTKEKNQIRRWVQELPPEFQLAYDAYYVKGCTQETGAYLMDLHQTTFRYKVIEQIPKYLKYRDHIKTQTPPVSRLASLPSPLVPLFAQLRETPCLPVAAKRLNI